MTSMVHESKSQEEIQSGVRLWARKQVISLLITALILFLSAGRLDWGMGWLFMAAYIAVVIAQAVILIPRNPGLLAERSRVQKGSKSWDLWLTAMAVIILPMLSWLIAGLDYRNGWTEPMTLWTQLAAVGVFLLAYGFIIWAMASNPFFSATIRLQEDRKQRVVASGPYAWMRHPGYLGAILFQTSTPIVLGSVWALIPALIASVLMVVRTALEDKTLRAELKGYEKYAQRVRYRLLPGVW